MSTGKQGVLSIESKNIFSILKRWLYSDQDIVFRELVSNAIDAIEKRPEGEVGEVRVRLDADNRQLIVSDNGIGMSADEVDRYINQIAFSGAEDFVRQNAQAGERIIGHFGVGFYSAFMLADHVAIETKSHDAAEQATRWDCTADMAFTMAPGGRRQSGTDVILFLPEESPWLREPKLAFDALVKYFAFVRTRILFNAPGYDGVQVNDPAPLWRQAPQAVDPEAVNRFYKSQFQDASDPLHWFQFASLDLGLRGVLFFRNTKNGTDELDGTIKVYCRGVYVGENIKGLIPRFVNLQNGIIECDRLPLVVSRGELRSGEEDADGDIIALVNECLTQEVAIEMNELFTNRRAQYEQYWPELNAFVKYAILQDKTFASVMSRKVIFEDINGQYHTLAEYTEGTPARDTVYYASDRLDQAHYIGIVRKLGENALLFDHVIDQPLLLKLETLYPKLKFIRIDSNDASLYHGAAQPGDEAFADKLCARLETLLGARLGAVCLQCTRMASGEVPALIVNDENARRMTDMMEIYGFIDPDNLAEKEKQAKSTLLLNLNNDIVQFLASAPEGPVLTTAAAQLFDLALLSQQLLRPEDMEAFIGRNEEMLKAYIAGC